MTNFESNHQLHNQAKAYFRALQLEITASLEAVDEQSKFMEDSWDRPGGGGGFSRVLEQGKVFEKAGVNFSEVYGEFSPEMAKQMPGDGLNFTATGVSLVIHPLNPYVPTVHMNFRMLTHGTKVWFGGGADLTPFYPHKEDVIHFHRTWRNVCLQYQHVVNYDAIKKECDAYFYLKHRQEARGVGGIFFDYLDADAEGKAFDFVQAAGRQFLSSYLPIVERRKDVPYSPDQKHFQEYRRGRYVEFNLIYDRGTLFGLKTDGRIESILMSLPPTVRYIYNYTPHEGSAEAALTDYWLIPRDWANESLE